MKATRGIVLALALLASGCFTMRHELPAGAHFGGRSEAAPAGTPLDRAASKNYALAGLVPYSSFGAAALLGPDAPPRIQIREIETVFAPFDVAISIVPGLFYGYYVWAPRTLHVRGEVLPAADGASD